MKKLRIANLNLKIECVNKQFFYNRFLEYECNNFIKADMSLKTIAYDYITKPTGAIVDQVGDASILSLGSNRFCRYLTDNKTGNIINVTYYNDTYSEVEIHLFKRYKQSDFTLTEFEYMYTGFAFSDRLTELGGVVLHGSAVSYDNQGIIFSANSGIGKSTHTNLWKERFGSKVIMVNDDKPAIRFYNGIPYMFGTPWSGKSDLNANIQVPIKALVFIKRAETNWIERLNVKNSVFNLTNQIYRPYYDEKIGMKTIEFIDKLVQTTPVYRLHCNISQEAVETVFKQFIREGVIKV